MSMDSDDDEMNIEALEELLGSNSADMEEIEKNAELDEADAAFFDQLEDQIEDLNGDTNDTAMDLDFTEPDESVSKPKLPEEPMNFSPLGNVEEYTENTASETTENVQVEESNLVEESKPLITADSEIDSLRSSLHSMQSQALDSDDDPELMNKADESIDQLINAMKEEEEAVESSTVDDAPESANASSLSKSIDVFSKLLPSHSVDGSTSLSADLQATAKALAAVSPNFEIGVKGRQSGLFGRFRRSGVPIASNEEFEKEETKACPEGDEAGEESNERSSKESKSGFFNTFRGISKQDQGIVQELEESGQHGTDDADMSEEESNTEASSNLSTGFFGAFRASQSSETHDSTTEDEENNNDKDKEEVAEVLDTDSSSTGGLFNAFRTSPTSENQESSNEEKAGGDPRKEENGTSPRFFSVFRGKPSQSSEHSNDRKSNNGSEKNGEEQESNTDTDSSPGGGFFGVFRASPKSNTCATLGDNENVDEGKEGTTTAESTTSESGSRFNVFRKFIESKKEEQSPMNLSPFEEDENEATKAKKQVTENAPVMSQEILEDTPDVGPGMFGYVSRKREEWSRRGTIDFPKTGPYSERTIRVGKLLAEGSSASVFHATHYEDSETLYVLKRINVLDDAAREACEKESIICNVLSDQKECIMPMLGYIVDEEQSLCYMLFPFMHLSLRAEMDIHFAKDGLPEIPPWDEKVALYMFYLLLHAVDALHGIGYSHRNIQVENIYLSSWKRPVLSGFKNAGPLSRRCSSAKDIFEIANTASQSTNMAYRPPELFPGAVMVGHDPLNYCLVDCWSLGCTLFVILYGVSPFECTFDPETGAIVKQECDQMSILADIPFPPTETPSGQWYSDEVKELILFVLEKDRAKRPSLTLIQAKVSSLLTNGIDPDEVPDVSKATEKEDLQS